MKWVVLKSKFKSGKSLKSQEIKEWNSRILLYRCNNIRSYLCFILQYYKYLFYYIRYYYIITINFIRYYKIDQVQYSINHTICIHKAPSRIQISPYWIQLIHVYITLVNTSHTLLCMGYFRKYKTQHKQA